MGYFSKKIPILGTSIDTDTPLKYWFREAGIDPRHNDDKPQLELELVLKEVGFRSIEVI